MPLIVRQERCLIDRLAMRALDQAGRPWDVVLDAPSSTSIAAAVAAGLGIHAGISRLVPPNVAGWHDAPLPPLPAVDCGIYLRDSSDRRLLETLQIWQLNRMRRRHRRCRRSEPFERIAQSCRRVGVIPDRHRREDSAMVAQSDV